jgi:protein involved in polysaccharide export with SLBB domain
MNSYTKPWNLQALLVVTLGFLLNFLPASAADSNDTIHKGDILEIDVYKHQELSRTIMVQQDGTVDYPLIANIPVDGLSLEEFTEIVKTQSTKYLGETPIISVRFSQTIQVNVTVLGQVMMPGEYLVAKNSSIQGAITRAGGFTPRSRIDQVKLIREKDGKRQIIPVDMHRFFLEGDPSILPELENGDTVVVPGLPGSNEVKVIGEVKTPGSYAVFIGANLLDVILMAGGPTKDASMKKIQIVSISQRDVKGVQVNLEKILQSRNIGEIPEISAGDVVSVPVRRTFFTRLESLMKNLSTIALPIAMIVYYFNYFGR